MNLNGLKITLLASSLLLSFGCQEAFQDPQEIEPEIATENVAQDGKADHYRPTRNLDEGFKLETNFNGEKVHSHHLKTTPGRRYSLTLSSIRKGQKRFVLTDIVGNKVATSTRTKKVSRVAGPTLIGGTDYVSTLTFVAREKSYTLRVPHPSGWFTIYTLKGIRSYKGCLETNGTFHDAGSKWGIMHKTTLEVCTCSRKRGLKRAIRCHENNRF